MTSAISAETDKPGNPPYPGGEDEHPEHDPRGPGEDVKEPPLPGVTGAKNEFPRKGDR